MALGTGSIRFSQIVSEFGGVSPHRFSEYKSLSGLGVSGVPASGSMRFSQFRGKSNQVSTQVWVSSGYSSSSWVYRGSGYEHVKKVSGQRIWSVHTWGFSFYVINHSTTYFRDGWKFTAGAFYYRGRNDYEYYKVNAYQSSTTWIDTSAYQTQTTTARIST